MQNLFSSIYKYRQREAINQKENFLTEIFAYALNNDVLFRTKFLLKLGIDEDIDEEYFKCRTQYVDEEGRPDVFIEINNDIEIAIESKVDARQGHDQLNSYARFLLARPSKRKILVFLTKYHEDSGQVDGMVPYKLRWYQIHELLMGSKHAISLELIKYLEAEKMGSKVSFENTDLQLMLQYQAFISKMNDALQLAKNELEQFVQVRFRNHYKPENAEYGLGGNVKCGTIWIGFYQYDEHETLRFCLDLQADSSNSLAKRILHTEQKWESYPLDNKVCYYRYWELTDFYVDGVFDSGSFRQLFRQEVENVKALL